MVSNKGSTLYTTQKTHKKPSGKILVAGMRLNIGVRGPGKKPSWRETRSSGTGVATRAGVLIISGGVAHIPKTLETKGNRGTLLGGVHTRWKRESFWSGN